MTPIILICAQIMPQTGSLASRRNRCMLWRPLFFGFFRTAFSRDWWNFLHFRNSSQNHDGVIHFVLSTHKGKVHSPAADNSNAPCCASSLWFSWMLGKSPCRCFSCADSRSSKPEWKAYSITLEQILAFVPSFWLMKK